jgi:hypothetical protein
VFIGSYYSDSQLVKLASTDPKIQVIHSFPSLAPILDFQVVNTSHSGTDDQQDQYSSGQSRIVSGCGGFTTGGLRSVRNGVGLKDAAILGEMQGARGLWALQSDPTSGYVCLHCMYLECCRLKIKGSKIRCWFHSSTKPESSALTQKARSKSWKSSRVFPWTRKL